MSEIVRTPRLKAFQPYKKLMKRYYLQARYAYWFGKKVAWVTSGAPVEFLYSMDVIPIYPENHGAICGASKVAVELCRAAESEGYSPDICSYMRCDIGSSITAKSPIGRMPRPDFLVCCNNICGTVRKWFQIQSRFYNAPLFVIDTPFVHHAPLPHAIHYVKQQLQDLVIFIEKNSRRKFTERKLTPVLLRAQKGIALWKEILDLNKNKPAPISCFDMFIYLAPIVTMRGTRRLIRFYQLLKKEIEKRVACGIGAISQEKKRLLWDNIPIWYEMRNLANTFSSYGVNLVADTYTTAWTMADLDTSNPMASLARTYATAYLNLGLEVKVKKMMELMERYSVDGFIMHSNRSCKPYSLGQYDIKQLLTQKTGKPGLIIEADMTDSRTYTDALIKTQIEAFIELL